MLNGLTGRKCMVYRTTHADPFSNVWTNQIDAAIILYGNNTKEKLNYHTIDSEVKIILKGS